jgi:hypothetical protein
MKQILTEFLPLIVASLILIPLDKDFLARRLGTMDGHFHARAACQHRFDAGIGV